MRAWLREYNGILELGKKLQSERTAVERLTTRRQSIRDSISTAMTGVAAPIVTEATTVIELVELAQHRLDELQAHASQYQQLSKSIVHLHQELHEAEEDLQQADNDVAAWKSDWVVTVKHLHLPDDATSEQAISVLENLTKLFQEHREAESFRLRIYGIDADAREFTEDVAAIARRLAPDLVEWSVEESATELHSRAVQAREARQRVDSLNDQITEQQTKLKDAQTSISETNAELAAMRVEAKCDRVENLAEADERSTQKRRLQESLATLEHQLRSLSGGQGIEAFSAEAAQENSDQLAPH